MFLGRHEFCKNSILCQGKFRKLLHHHATIAVAFSSISGETRLFQDVREFRRCIVASYRDFSERPTLQQCPSLSCSFGGIEWCVRIKQRSSKSICEAADTAQTRANIEHLPPKVEAVRHARTMACRMQMLSLIELNSHALPSSCRAN